MDQRDPHAAHNTDAASQLLRLLGGKWVTAAISAAASLGLADALAGRPATLDTLADQLRCDRQALLRLLRVLCGEGLAELQPDGSYRLTELGRQLETDKLRDLAIYTGAPFMWHPWAALDETVQTGKSAFARTHGQPLFEYLDNHPREAELYQAAVDAFTRHEAAALSSAFDFSAARTIVDVGGGLGTLLEHLLATFAHLRGVLLERPAVVEQARSRHAAAAWQGRCDFVSGNFFESVPSGGDVYVVMHVLHNWDHPQATQILQNCRAAMTTDASLLIIEGVLLPGNRKDATSLLDLEMLALCGKGRERTKPQFRQLLHAAGLQLSRSCDLAGTTRLLQCKLRPS